MTENEIKNAIRTINAKLEEALEREKETEGTEDTVIWHMVGNDYKCAIKALEEIQQYRAIGTVEECREARERQRGKKPEFELNLSDYTSRFVCECGKRVIVKHDSGVMDNHDAPNYCSNCGQRFDWSDTD